MSEKCLQCWLLTAAISGSGLRMILSLAGSLPGARVVCSRSVIAPSHLDLWWEVMKHKLNMDWVWNCSHISPPEWALTSIILKIICREGDQWNLKRSLMPKIRIRAEQRSVRPLARSSTPLSPHSPLTRAILGIWTWLLASRHDTLSEQNLSGDICKHCTEMSFLFDSWILACPRNVNSLNSISSSHHASVNYTCICIHLSINYYESLCHAQKGVLV